MTLKEVRIGDTVKVKGDPVNNMAAISFTPEKDGKYFLKEKGGKLMRSMHLSRGIDGNYSDIKFDKFRIFSKITQEKDENNKKIISEGNMFVGLPNNYQEGRMIFESLKGSVQVKNK